MAVCPSLSKVHVVKLYDCPATRYTTCLLDGHHISVERDRRHDRASPEQDFRFLRKVSPQLRPQPYESSSRFSTNQNPHELRRTSFRPRKRTTARQCETSWSVDPW